MESSKSIDYTHSGILFLDDSKNYSVDPTVTFTKDKDEEKWDYFREDPRLHVFHSLLHRVFMNLQNLTFDISSIFWQSSSN